MSMSKNCRTGCSTGGPGSSRASGLRNMAGGCCGRLLGGETFQGERLTRGRVYDIGRPYASLCQTLTTVREFALSNCGASSIEKANLVPFGAPIDTGKP